jgi:hypothetical protein
LLVDPARCPFAVLIGGESWAAELTQAEASLLALGAERLVDQHANLVDHLLAEEAITLEWESGELWLALEGDRQAWQLRFVLTPASGQRAFEGAWTPTASRAVAAALQAVRRSLSDPA